jgi:hypothetical protein
MSMNWTELYGADNQPSRREIDAYISNPLWDSLNSFLVENYEVSPSYSYSGCSGQPGWNVKYQKAGRSLCTLYPMQGFFIALVVIGAKEDAEASLLIPTCDESIQTMYRNTKPLMGGRWLMVNVTNERILDDVRRLIQCRRKIKKKV